MSLAVTVWFAVMRGQDINWDQRNYHVGLAYLLSNAGVWDNVAPAGVQTFLNPYVIQLKLLGIRHLGPIAFAAVQGAVQSAAFILAWFVCAALAGPLSRRRNGVSALAGFALCLMAPLPLSEAGTTFIDLDTAIPVIAAYLLLLIRDRQANPLPWILIAGALLGMATALKLTNAVFAVAAAGFFVAGPEDARQRMTGALALGAAAGAGFLAIGGAWHWNLWERFANPFFPYFNNIFGSRDFDSVTLRDLRFVGASAYDIWRYPFLWFAGESTTPYTGSPSSEVEFTDARWMFAVGASTVFLGVLACFRRWRQARMRETATGFIFAFATGYLIWLFLFGIHRYVIAIDILCGAVLLALTRYVPGRSVRPTLLLAVAAISIWRIEVPDWGHRPWLPHWQTISPQVILLEGRSLVFLADNPTLLIAPMLPPRTRYVEISGSFDLRASNDTYLTRQLKKQIASVADDAIWLVDRGWTPDLATATLASHGLRPGERCEIVQIAVDSLRLCAVVRTGPVAR